MDVLIKLIAAIILQYIHLSIKSSHGTPQTSITFSSDQSISCVWLFATPQTVARQAWLPYPSPTPGDCSNSCPSNQWCHPTISSFVAPFSCPQSFPASGSFQWVSSSHQLATILELQHWSFQWWRNFSWKLMLKINEYSRLISFRTDWLDPLATQSILKSLLQDHSLKASII